MWPAVPLCVYFFEVQNVHEVNAKKEHAQKGEEISLTRKLISVRACTLSYTLFVYNFSEIFCFWRAFPHLWNFCEISMAEDHPNCAQGPDRA